MEMSAPDAGTDGAPPPVPVAPLVDVSSPPHAAAIAGSAVRPAPKTTPRRKSERLVSRDSSRARLTRSSNSRSCMLILLASCDSDGLTELGSLQDAFTRISPGGHLAQMCAARA